MGKAISKKTVNRSNSKGKTKKNFETSVHGNNKAVENAMDFDPEKVLEEINSSLDIDEEFVLPDIANDAIEELKKSGELSSTLNNKELSDADASKINDTLDKLTALSESLEKDINDRLGKLSETQKKQLDNLTTSFWGGVLNTW